MVQYGAPLGLCQNFDQQLCGLNINISIRCTRKSKSRLTSLINRIYADSQGQINLHNRRLKTI